MNTNLTKYYINIDLTNFDASKYFENYHYFEKFDQNGEYTDEIFKKDYGHGDFTYKYILYILGGTEKYIIVEEELSQENRDQLIPFCKCPYHKMSWMNPFRFFVCRCCVGCLESPFTQQYVINDARKYFETHSWRT